MTLYLHAGIFHADDVFCTAFFRLLGGYTEVCRVMAVTEEMLAEAAAGKSVIADIGGFYEPDRNLFDHHQPDAPARGNGIRYASFGMVVRHFWQDEWGSYERFDQEFVQPIDACDNGQGRYAVNHLIKMFVPPWNSEDSMEAAFIRAVDFAEGILRRELEHRKANAAAEGRVLEALSRAQSGIVTLEQYAPFESFLDASSGHKAVIYPDLRGGYDVRILPLEIGKDTLSGSFQTVAQGENGCRFLHRDGFLACFDTYEQAYQAAEQIR